METHREEKTQDQSPRKPSSITDHGITMVFVAKLRITTLRDLTLLRHNPLKIKVEVISIKSRLGLQNESPHRGG